MPTAGSDSPDFQHTEYLPTAMNSYADTEIDVSRFSDIFKLNITDYLSKIHSQTQVDFTQLLNDIFIDGNFYNGRIEYNSVQDSFVFIGNDPGKNSDALIRFLNDNHQNLEGYTIGAGSKNKLRIHFSSVEDAPHNRLMLQAEPLSGIFARLRDGLHARMVKAGL